MATVRAATSVAVALAIILRAPAAGAAPAALSMPAMKLLESLGLPSFSMNSITEGERLRQQDSPIYYIKLPASSHPPFTNSIDFVPYVGDKEQDYVYKRTTTKSPFQQVPVDFTNNGRPDQIFHWSGTTSNHFWNYKPFKPATTNTPDGNTASSSSSTSSNIDTTKPAATSKPNTTTTTSTSTTTTTTVRPKTTSYQFPTITAWPPQPSREPTSKKPWVSFVKQYQSNGRPSGLYIYKSKPVFKTHKHKHPLFRHFNY